MNRIHTTKSSYAIPKLSAATVTACQKELANIAELYAVLLDRDAVAASWLQDATEYLAPANPAEKQKYARLALELYYMLLYETKSSAA